jgi:hypothetical protein
MCPKRADPIAIACAGENLCMAEAVARIMEIPVGFDLDREPSAGK